MKLWAVIKFDDYADIRDFNMWTSALGLVTGRQPLDGYLILKVIFIPCILVYTRILTMVKKKEGIFWHCVAWFGRG